MLRSPGHRGSLSPLMLIFSLFLHFGHAGCRAAGWVGTGAPGDRLMIWDRDTGPSPAGEEDNSQLLQRVGSTRNGCKLGWFLLSHPQEPALALRCQTQTGLGFSQGAQKSLERDLSPGATSPGLRIPEQTPGKMLP